MLFDGLLIEHQCRPQAVAAAGTSGTIVYRNLFLSSLLGRPIQCFPVPTSVRYGENTTDGNSTPAALRILITFSLNIDAAPHGNWGGAGGGGGDPPAQSVALQLVVADHCRVVVIWIGAAVNMEGDLSS